MNIGRINAVLWGIFGTLLAAIALAQTVTGTGTVTLSWERPTTYTDGTPLPIGEIAGYAVYFGQESRAGRCTEPPTGADDTTCYPLLALVDNGGVLTTELPDIELSGEADGSGQYVATMYFAMATIATNGEVSDYSNEAMKQFTLTIDGLEPNAPIVLGVDASFTCEADEAGLECTVTVQ